MRVFLFYIRESLMVVVALVILALIVAGAFVLPAMMWIGLMVLFLLTAIFVRLGRRA